MNPASRGSGNLSRQAHNALFRDTDESLCSRAWRMRHASPFWAGWVRLFGHEHCRKAHEIHHVIRKLRHALPPCDCR